MKILMSLVCVAGLIAAIPAVRADGGCTAQDEKEADIQLKKMEGLERAGKLREAFEQAVFVECISDAHQRVIALRQRVGKTLGQQEEKKGQLDNAFDWYDQSGLVTDADRVKMLQVKSRPEDSSTFSNAYEYFKFREDEATLKDLRHIASKNADKMLVAEDQAFATRKESFDELGKAHGWLQYLGEDQEKRMNDRAEKRGDVLAEKDGLGMLENALRYYEVADKPHKVVQVKEKAMRLADGYAKSGESRTAANFYNLAGAIDKADAIEKQFEDSHKQGDTKRQEQFKKDQDALEKDLGF